MLKRILNNVTSCCIASVSISACTIHVALILLCLVDSLVKENEKILIICAFFPPLVQFVAVILGSYAFIKSSGNRQQIGSMLCAIFSIIIFTVVILAEIIYISMGMNAPHLA